MGIKPVNGKGGDHHYGNSSGEMGALRESEELFRVLADTSMAAIFLVQDNKIIYSNPTARQFLGYSQEEFFAMDFWEPVHPDFREQIKTYGLSLLYGERAPGRFEIKFVKKNGEVGWCIVTIAPVSYKGKVAGVVSALDITERKRTEETLQESEEKFRVLMETTRAGVFLIQDARFTYVNPAAERILGIPREKLLGMYFWEPVHHDFREQALEYQAALYRGESIPRHLEIAFLGKDGEKKWCDLAIGTFKYKGRMATVVIVLDVTKRKRAEMALKESEEKFRVLAETSPAGIFLYQGEKLVYANPAARDFTEFTLDELVKKNFWDMVHPQYRDMVKKYGLARQQGKAVPSRYEVQYVTSRGETRWAEFAAGQIEYRGKPAGIVIALDITEHKRSEAALLDAKAQAELYVDLMGHDINNLNQVALGYLELATERLELDDKTRVLVEKPIEALEKSSQLISKVKKLQLMRSGALETVTMDVGRVLDDVVRLYARAPDREDADREIVINYRYAPGLVEADELLADVFSNLVTNAIKHSPCDRPLVIDIGMARAREGGRDYFKVCIDDNGPGIPDEKKEDVFGRFARRPGGVKGGGLGLYLVKSLVEKYGGKVWVENRVPGDHTKGCRFVVMLPAADRPRDINL